MGLEVAVTITDGIGAAATTSTGITAVTVISRVSLYSPSSPIARTMREWQRCERSRPQGAAGSAGIELESLDFRRSSAQPHLDGDPDQVRMVLGAELLLEQGRGIGDGLVGNLQRIGDFDDLVAAAQ